MEQQTPGQEICKEFKIEINQNPLGSLYAFVDELIFVLRYIGYYFLSAMAVKNPRAVTFYRLSIQMLSTLASIRALCGLGLDSNARMQLRLLYETTILWCRFIFDEEARQAFEACDSPAVTNSFWHRYVSKQKSEKYIKNKTSELSLNWLGDYDDGRYLADAQMRMGLAAHPSLLGVSYDTMQSIQSPSTSSFGSGSTSGASSFTLSSAIFVTTMPFCFLPEIDYKLRTVDMLERGPFYPANHKASSWEEYCRIVRLMPMSLFLASIQFSNGVSRSIKATAATQDKAAAPEP